MQRSRSQKIWRDDQLTEAVRARFSSCVLREPSMSSASIHIVVLAAGQGTRMKSSLPKVLHRVPGGPMLDSRHPHGRIADAGDPDDRGRPRRRCRPFASEWPAASSSPCSNRNSEQLTRFSRPRRCLLADWDARLAVR